MPWTVASWPVVGKVPAFTLAFCRTVITAPARPSLASIEPVVSGWAVYHWVKMLPAWVLSQAGVKFWPISVAPPAVLVAGSVAIILVSEPQTTLL